MAKPVFACGVVLFIVLTSVARLDARANAGAFVWLMGVAALAYVVALRLVAQRPAATRRELIVCLLLAVAWRLALIGAAPLVSDDVYRYVWDGRVQRYGLNPYETVPADPALALLHTDLTRQIDPTNAALPTIYPPAAERFFLLVTAVHESVMAMAVAVVLCDLLTALLLWRWLVVTSRNPWWVLAYAWHPLVALEAAGGAHIDVVGTLLLVGGAYALSRRRSLLAAVALTGAFAVKFLPVVLIPLLWRRIRLRHGLLAAGLVLLLYAPFSGGSFTPPVGSLGVYAEQWRFNGPWFRLLAPWVGAFGGLALAAAGGLGVAVMARRRLDLDTPDAWSWPMATALLLMPAIYPWYLVWLTPFLTSRAAWPLIAWTVVSPLTYVVWTSELAGTGWVLPVWVEPVEYGLVAAVGLWAWWQRPRASGS